MTAAIKVVVADDHKIIRDGLRQLLNRQDNIEVIGTVADAVEAFTMVRQLRPDVLILDIALPNMNGFEVVKQIHRLVPETKIVIHSMYEKAAYTDQVFSAGAVGYVLKAAPSADIINAIRAVAQGEYFLNSKLRAESIGSYLPDRDA